MTSPEDFLNSALFTASIKELNGTNIFTGL